MSLHTTKFGAPLKISIEPTVDKAGVFHDGVLISAMLSRVEFQTPHFLGYGGILLDTASAHPTPRKSN